MKYGTTKGKGYDHPVLPPATYTGDMSFADRKLAGTNPNSEQFVPSPESPIRQRVKMAGVSVASQKSRIAGVK